MPAHLRRLTALAEATLTDIRDGIATALDIYARPYRPDLAVAPAAETMAVRHLTVEHLGRWIELPGRPAQMRRPAIDDPSIAATGGRLVGFKPGQVLGSGSGTVAQRVLVVMMGGPAIELTLPTNATVHVAPREW